MKFPAPVFLQLFDDRVFCSQRLSFLAQLFRQRALRLILGGSRPRQLHFERLQLFVTFTQ